MALTELEKIFEEISKNSNKADKKELKRDGFGDILTQRHFQRAVLFWCALGINFLSYLILIGLFISQAKQWIRLDSSVMGVFISVVFAQSFGIIYKIATSIWDDRPYRNLLMFKEKNNNGKK